MNTKEIKNITSFNEFLEFIKSFENDYENNRKTFRAVYRGVQEKGNEIHLTPSLEWQELTQYESELIKEMKRLKPKKFTLPQLELIEVLRHYGLPTRLLDFSLSAFVALYFAVTTSEVDKTGETKYRIYCMKVRENNLYAETIARISNMEPYEFYIEHSTDNQPIEKVLFLMDLNEERKKEKIRNFLKNMYSSSTSAVFTYPQTYTEREEHQQSIFMIYCNDVYDSVNKKNLSDNLGFINNIEKENNVLDRFYFKSRIFNPFDSINDLDFKIIEISSNVVDDFKKQLNLMGVNEAYLFPDNLEHMANQTVDKIKNMYKKK